MTVAVFPGTWSERDFAHVASAVLGWEARLAWHTETDLGAPDAVVLPGGFAHGDHLRTGAIARFSPIMASVEAFAAARRAGDRLLQRLPGPGRGRAAPRARSCATTTSSSAATGRPSGSSRPRSSPAWLGDLRDGDVIRLPISHGEGRYVADPVILDELEATGRVVLRYADADGRVTAAANPNGSERGIAGIVNERGNVLGLMPHPERASEVDVGGTDGLRLFRSLERWLHERPALAERRL